MFGISATGINTLFLMAFAALLIWDTHTLVRGRGTFWTCLSIVISAYLVVTNPVVQGAVHW